MKRLFTYLRSTITNNCLLLHVHKDFTDELSLTEVAKHFVSANVEQSKYFGSYPV